MWQAGERCGASLAKTFICINIHRGPFKHAISLITLTGSREEHRPGRVLSCHCNTSCLHANATLLGPAKTYDRRRIRHMEGGTVQIIVLQTLI